MPKKTLTPKPQSQDLFPTLPYPTGNEEQIQQEFGISAGLLRYWREHPELGFQEQIHYVKLSKRSIVYNRKLVHSYIHHGAGSRQHQEEIDRYMRYCRGA